MLLNRLVEDLKLLSLAEAGQLKLERQKPNLAFYFGRLWNGSDPRPIKRTFAWNWIFKPDIPVVWIDSDRITQVLNNLIGNALRYTPDGRTIKLQGSINPSTGSIEVSVTDTGQGIASDNLPFIFDRFYRADKSRTRSSGGSGLGLAIVKQLVEAHGGNVKHKAQYIRTRNNRITARKLAFHYSV